MNEAQHVHEVDLSRIFKALARRWWALLLPAIALAAAFFAYTKTSVTPMYQATSIMYINASTSSTINLSELETAQKLVSSYEYLIKRIPQTLTEVADKLNEDAKEINDNVKLQYEQLGLIGVFEFLPEDYTREQLSKMVSVKGGSSTEFLEITVTCETPSEAARIANRIMDVVPGRAAAANMNSTISPAGWASDPGWDNPSSPNLTNNVLIGFMIGLLIGAVIVIMVEVLDDRIKSDDWIKNTFGEEIPLLAIIPSAGRRQERYGAYGAYAATSTPPEDPTE